MTLVPGRSAAFWPAAWLLLTATAIAVDPLFPIDETRYAAVAWEMWSQQSFLVPWLNGETYSHKPPFLFWLFHVGWFAFGVNEWWLRLGPALFGLGALFLTRSLARQLWPDAPRAAELAPLVVLGSGLWAVFTGAVMFDLVLAFWVLLALLGFLRASGGEGVRWWLLTGIAIGLGILTKGPVILLHVLPAALLAPWWSGWPLRRGRWYVGVVGSVLLGAAVALAWAVPAAMGGGEAYADAILWGQTAGRVANSFAHALPWWWYLPLLPLLLLPWTAWPGLWRSLVGMLRQRPLDAGVRFCIAWAVPVFVAFSLVSGKRVHYLLPLFPAFGLLAARALTRLDHRGIRASAWPAGVLLLVFAALLFALPELAARLAPDLAEAGLSRWWGALPAGLGLFLFRRLPFDVLPQALLAVTVTVVLTLQWGVVRPVRSFLDTTPVARELARLQQNRSPLASIGIYRGEYHFSGRLQEPVAVVNPASAPAWAAAHPGGFLFGGYRAEPPLAVKPVKRWKLRGRTVAIWPAGAVAE